MEINPFHIYVNNFEDDDEGSEDILSQQFFSEIDFAYSESEN